MKTFVDFTYECEEAVFSEQHQAYLVEYFQDPSDLPQTYDIDCYQSITSRYAVVYQRSDEVIAGQYQGKLIVPRCFGFLEENYEPDSAANAGPGSSALLEAAGITRARQEPLSLDGRGMLIGIIDSGGGVRMCKTGVLPLQEFLRNSCWRLNRSRCCSVCAWAKLTFCPCKNFYNAKDLRRRDSSFPRLQVFSYIYVFFVRY